MPPRKRKHNLCSSRSRYKKRLRLKGETPEERDRRLEYVRVRSFYIRERQSEIDGRMLQRLEIYLQSLCVKNEEDDSDESGGDEMEPVRINIPKSEILKLKFPIHTESAENDCQAMTEDGMTEAVEKYEPYVTCRPDFDTDRNDGASDHASFDSTEPQSKLDPCSIEVKEEIIDESYENFDVHECFIKEEDDEVDEIKQEIEFDEVSDGDESCNEVTNDVPYDVDDDDDLNYETSPIEVDYAANQQNIPVTAFECEICLKKYPSKSRLKMHSLIHELYPEFKYVFDCRICRTRFPRKLILRNHMLSHERNLQLENLKCDVCETRFTRPKDLYKHLLNHIQKDRNLKFLYRCRLCGEGFIHATKLKNHELSHRAPVVHDDSSNFESTRDSLYMFRPDRHSGSSFTCDTCGKQFTLKGNLKKHVLKYHSCPLGYMFECEIKTGVENEPSISFGPDITEQYSSMHQRLLPSTDSIEINNDIDERPSRIL